MMNSVMNLKNVIMYKARTIHLTDLVDSLGSKIEIVAYSSSIGLQKKQQYGLNLQRMSEKDQRVMKKHPLQKWTLAIRYFPYLVD